MRNWGVSKQILVRKPPPPPLHTHTHTRYRRVLIARIYSADDHIYHVMGRTPTPALPTSLDALVCSQGLSRGKPCFHSAAQARGGWCHMVWHDLQFCSSLSLLAFPPAGNQGLARGKPCCRTKLPIVQSAFKCLAPCCTSFIVSLNPSKVNSDDLSQPCSKKTPTLYESDSKRKPSSQKKH